MSSEVTLGELRNRISTLFADKAYKPQLPLSTILTPDEIQALLATVGAKPNGNR